MDSNLGGKARGGRPAPALDLASTYIKGGGEGCGTPLSCRPKHPAAPPPLHPNPSHTPPSPEGCRCLTSI